jgi:hypothetical protein
VRAAAGFVLALTGSVASSAALARAAAADPDPACACDLRIAAGWLLARTEGELAALPEDAPDLLVAGDAIGRAYAGMDEAAVWELYELLGAPQRNTDSLWADGDHTAHAVALLARHAERSGNLAVLTDALDLAPAELVPKLALPMLRVVFDDELLVVSVEPRPCPPRSELTHAQFDVLRLLQSREDVWSLELRDTLLGLGLQDSPVKLRRYLRVRGEPTILDRVIVIDGDAQRLRRRWQMACLRKSTLGPALAAAVVDQLTPAEVVQAVVLGARAEVASNLRSYELELLILHALGLRSPAEIDRQLRWWYSKGHVNFLDSSGFTRSGTWVLTSFWLALWRLRSTDADDTLLRRMFPVPRLMELLTASRLIHPEIRQVVAEARRWRYPDEG